MAMMESRKTGDLLLLANGIVAVILLNVLASQFFFRLDLTEEKRYSIKQPTREMLSNLDDEVHVEVFLEGDLNPGFERFKKAIGETLEEFRIYSGDKVQYSFTNPAQATGRKAQSEFMSDLAARGIQPTNVIDNKDGKRVENLIFPGAIVSYGGTEVGVMFLKGNKAQKQEVEINQSIEGVEYELANTIHRLTALDHKRVGLIEGHGELDSIRSLKLREALLESYDVTTVDLKDESELSHVDVLISAKPRTAFSPVEKYNLDQYLMHGGRAMLLLDKLEASMDSASLEGYLAFPYNLNLDDQLFKYGVRINADLVQDRTSSMYPVITGQSGGKPQIKMLDWPYFPLINHYADHPITRNLDAVITKFTSTVDTVKAAGIKKTPIMFTSQYSRKVDAPVEVSVNEFRRKLTQEDFPMSYVPVGYLLEGKFTSLFKNRFAPDGANNEKFIPDGAAAAKLIVIADGDLAENVVNPRNGEPQPLGFDPFTKYTFANRDLLLNAVAYLADEGGLINARSKQVKIRPLDKDKIAAEKTFWKILNIGFPLFVLIAYGVVRFYLRKRRFASF